MPAVLDQFTSKRKRYRPSFKIRKEGNSLIICFHCWMAVSSEQGEKGGRKIERMNPRETVHSEWICITASVSWEGQQDSIPFPVLPLGELYRTHPLFAPDCTCKMEITSEVSSVKCFEIYWKKKKIQNKKPTTHTKWLSSFEFHENSACKLCGSVILGTPCSWLQYYYSTWSR